MRDKILNIINKFEGKNKEYGAKHRFIKKIGISSGHLTAWLSGRAKPNIDYQKKICKAYNLPLNYFKEKETADPEVKKYEHMSKSQLLFEIGKFKGQQELNRYFIDQIGYFKDILVNRDKDIVDIKEKCDLLVRNNIKKTPKQSS